MKRLFSAAVAMLFAGIALGAATVPSTGTATAPRMGTDGRPADTRSILEPYTDLVLLGDSITDGWNNTGKAVWQKEFPTWKMANFGISGDTCQAVLYRITNGEFDGYQAKAIMLMLGTNNTRSYSGEEIGAAMTKIAGIIKDKQPQAKILLLAIFPRDADANDVNRKKTEVANKILAQLDDGKNVKFFDINSKFLDPHGNGTLAAGVALT